MKQRQFHVGRLVAINACYGTMRPGQGKARHFMVKLRQVFPFPGCVACFASQRLPRGIVRRHADRKLAFMYIRMTTGAGELIEVIRSYLQSWCRLVAFVARHPFVSPGQRKTGLLVFCQRVV